MKIIFIIFKLFFILKCRKESALFVSFVEFLFIYFVIFNIIIDE